MPAILQRSFAGGEVSPALNARADQARYQQGMSVGRNMHVLRDGSAANRAGTQFVAQTKGGGDDPVRLIPFRFNDAETLMIEAGAGYFRFYVDGARLRVSSEPAWALAQDYEVGDLVENGGSTWYCVDVHSSVSTDEPGVGVNSSTFWYELEDDIYEVPHPYTVDELMGSSGERLLDYVQANDVLVLLQQNNVPLSLSRLDVTKWVLSQVDFVPSVTRPAYCSATGPTPIGSGEIVRFTVTAIDGASGKESLAAPGTEIVAAAVWAYTPKIGVTPPVLQVAATAHGLVVGDYVTIGDREEPLKPEERSYEFYQRAYGKTLRVGTVVNANAVELDVPFDIEDNIFSAGILFGAPLHLPYAEGNFRAQSAFDPNDFFEVSWPKVNGATRYAVYMDGIQSGTFGLVNFAQGPDPILTLAIGAGDLPTYEETPPVANNPFTGKDNQPAVGGFFQQRLVLASTAKKPESIWFSRAGDIFNFSHRTPLQDDDAIERSITGREAQEIRGLIDLGERYVILTSDGEWVMSGDGGAATVDAFTIRQDGYNGSSRLRPVVANHTVLYNQARGSQILDLRNQPLETNSYVGRDLTSFARHLVEAREAVSWNISNVPDPTLYVAMSDGALVLFTYVAEQNIEAWTRADTRGILAGSEERAADEFVQVAVIPEGRTDTPYFVVRRRIGAGYVRYIERLAPRKANAPDYDIRSDARFLDSHGTYDGTNLTDDTMTVSQVGSNGWAVGAIVRITKTNADGSAPFEADDVNNGRGYRLSTVNDQGFVTEFEIHVTTFTSSTVIEGEVRTVRVAGGLVTEIPSTMHGVPTASWVRMARFLSGLDHLNNENVGALGDGIVCPIRRVSSGMYTLPEGEPRGIVHVGLPINASLEMLDIDAVSDDAISDRTKHVPWADLHVQQTRGVTAGPDLDDQQPMRMESEDPLYLHSGRTRVNTPSRADKNGRILIVQPDPLPLTLSAVTRAVDFGDR